MRVVRGRPTDVASEQRDATFTGRVWADPLLAAEDGVMLNNVFFEPGARTHWHRHEIAQVLHVVAGGGFVQTRAGDVSPLRAGDSVHIVAGEEHWHGAGPASYLLHLAVSIGTTEWLEPVAYDEYERAVSVS